MLSCLKYCFKGPGAFNASLNQHEIKLVALDSNYRGSDVVVIKDGLRICGSGGILGNAPLVQNKSYFEVKIQQTGSWSVGVATRQTNLNEAPGGDAESWVLCHTGVLKHNNKDIYQTDKTVVEGDVLGVTFDHIELKFYWNGSHVGIPITGIRSIIYPVVYVSESAVLDVIFDNFQNQIPNGFQRIMHEQSLL